VTPEEAALGRMLDVLERHGVAYMLTGSIATSYYGRPRSTHDADIVIDPTAPQLEALVRDLEHAGFYVDPDGARAALRHRRQFNIIDTAQACKLDLIILKQRPFSVEEFQRRQLADLLPGRPVSIVTAEDAILSKLEWARRTDSERQLRDAAGVLDVHQDLDREYIERWARELGVADLWAQLTRASDTDAQRPS
jgi:hypothetical protein